jgi:hypothetical protein
MADLEDARAFPARGYWSAARRLSVFCISVATVIGYAAPG